MPRVSIRTSTRPLSTAQIDVLRVTGYSYLQTGQLVKATALFHCLHGLQPKHKQIAASLAYTYIKRGLAKEAMAVINSMTNGKEDLPLFNVLRTRAAWLQKNSFDSKAVGEINPSMQLNNTAPFAPTQGKPNV
ncbi:MAG: tetratricopeptide repeat protein [Thiotrichales bacterium]